MHSKNYGGCMNDEPARESPPDRNLELTVSLAVVALGVAMAVATRFLPGSFGYAKVGPQLAPTIVSTGLIVLGLLLCKEAWFGGFRDREGEGDAANPANWRAFGWLSGALIVNALLMTRTGFLIAATVLFVLAAAGFGSRRWLLNGVVGAILSGLTYAFFNYGLGLKLPAGILPF
jgi:putative tricarboxylic transport membrane protein